VRQKVRSTTASAGPRLPRDARIARRWPAHNPARDPARFRTISHDLARTHTIHRRSRSDQRWGACGQTGPRLLAARFSAACRIRSSAGEVHSLQRLPPCILNSLDSSVTTDYVPGLTGRHARSRFARLAPRGEPGFSASSPTYPLTSAESAQAILAAFL